MSDPRIAAALLREAERRTSLLTAAERVCFDRQVRFLHDRSRRRALFTTRRAGKSMAGGLDILSQMLACRGRKWLYLGITGDAAFNAIYKDILEKYLEIWKVRHTFNHTLRQLTLTANKSQLKIAGMDARPSDMDKVLGGKYHAVLIDEAQSHKQNLAAMIEEKLAPAVSDYILDGGGQITLAGTPGDYMGEHLWYRITMQDEHGRPHPDRVRGWSVHEWSVGDNPFMRLQFEEECRRLAIVDPHYQQSSVFRRQWLKQWVLDTDAKIYKFDSARNALRDVNLIAELLSGRGGWSYVIGVDIGWDDATAISVLAYRMTDPTCYVVRTKRVTHSVLHQIAELLQELNATYRPVTFVVDTAGAAKILAESLSRDYGLPITAAEKQEKANHVGRLNDDLLAGRMRVIESENADLVEEWGRLIKDRRAHERGEWKENEKRANHAADATLYAHRYAYHHQAIPPETPKPTEERRTDEAIERLLARQRSQGGAPPRGRSGDPMAALYATHDARQFFGRR